MIVVSFLLPCVRAVDDFVLFGVTHDHNLAAQSLLTFLDKTGELIAYPVHLVRLGIIIGLDIVLRIVDVDIFEL